MTTRKRDFVRKGDLGWATFSPCERYRYVLYRHKTLGRVGADASGKAPKALRTGVFIMLNPSTADENQNDPTIRRALGFLGDHGCGDAYLLNLFGYRATKPVDLAKQEDPAGPNWDRHFDRTIRAAEESSRGAGGALIVCAWGSFHLIGDRALAIRKRLEALGLVPHGLRLNADGNPAHPLYMPKALSPRPLFELEA